MRPTTKQRPAPIPRECRIIDAAYGMILGAYDGLLGDDDTAAWAAWNTPKIQAAAMAAAEEFMKQIELKR